MGHEKTTALESELRGVMCFVIVWRESLCKQEMDGKIDSENGSDPSVNAQLCVG